MSPREQLVACIATLATLAIVFVAALIAAALSPGLMGKMEVFGLGTITGGLIGVLRIPSSRSPVATTDSGDVTVTPAPQSPQGE
ncbi:hypothetical protein [Sphingomonas abietis]|uniref:Uncharacterized protein n=1 Tax=Sphingomonas abietis TaxID=3012344 RepID=A0ABY7NQW9_9SPHN|nr:hypothetical protein [Sphingomonas abietis]WBO23918.1 hypothetical protein PBT88_07360 [Sphingomonas abietis]